MTTWNLKMLDWLKRKKLPFNQWEIELLMRQPSMADRYLADAFDPITYKQYAGYWSNFADSWSPGGSAPRIPGASGYGFVPDEELGTYKGPPEDDVSGREARLARNFRWLSPGAIRELARRTDMTEDELGEYLLEAIRKRNFR